MLEFLSISSIILLAVISPGPDFALVSRNALRYSDKAGIATALGIACSTLFHGSYCILGLAIIISKSLLFFSIIKYIGASYLIYIGIKGLLEKQHSSQLASSQLKGEITFLHAFTQGALCNAFNPKTILFFLALFTLMIKPTMPFIIQAGYAIEIALIHFIWFSVVSLLFSHHNVKKFLGGFQYYITKVFGGFLIAFGLKIAALTQD